MGEDAGKSLLMKSERDIAKLPEAGMKVTSEMKQLD
jgi:hypothetical protein